MLSLDFNLLTSLPPELQYLSNLEELSLSGNKFVDFPLVILQLPKISLINFNKNQITKIPADIIKLKDTLKFLYLEENNISILPDEVAELKSLEQLWLSKNPIDSNEKERIQKLLPDVGIHSAKYTFDK